MPFDETIAVRARLGGFERDPVNELYDRACDLVVAGAELRAAAARQNNDAAVAATLNCLETALEDAAASVDLLRSGSVDRIARAWPMLDDATAVSERVGEGFGDASRAIRAARRRCAELRGAVGPLLAELNAR